MVHLKNINKTKVNNGKSVQIKFAAEINVIKGQFHVRNELIKGQEERGR